ncbi:MAG: RimK family alpha-L-glutamate ligase [Betaproteobacteria bacterium]|nr:RimK family alpha-L-glutamate ligase [Betaproteobacteria bacterium]
MPKVNTGTTGGGSRVVILTDDPGWHGARLREAFLSRGVETSFASLRDCRFDLHRPGRSVVLPGFEERLPDGVFVRGVPGGTLEQVVLRLDVLHALKLLGVPVYNDGRAIERTVDKAMTSFVLANAGIPTPATWVTESESEAAAVVRAEIAAGREMVVKPLFGSQGVGLKRISAVDDLPPGAHYDGVYYLQRYVESGNTGWHDWRVFVIDGVAVAAMKRQGKSWITNVSQGGTCAPVDLSEHEDLRVLAQKACSALQMDYAGIDLIRDRDGRLQVIEVNGIPAWKGLQSVTRDSIARMLVDDFVDRHLRRRALHSVA